METKHTQGPLRVTQHRDLASEDGAILARPVYDTRHNSGANMDRLALCWNCHDELVAALELVAEKYQEHFGSMPVAWQSVDDAVNAAIAKAKGAN